MKAALSLVALGAVAYALALLHVMVLTLASMHADIGDMRGQLHRTTSALHLTNSRLEVVERKLNGTNDALAATIWHLSRTDRGVYAMKADTDRMNGALGRMQGGIFGMLGDIHRMTHRIVNAKLLF